MASVRQLKYQVTDRGIMMVNIIKVDRTKVSLLAQKLEEYKHCYNDAKYIESRSTKGSLLKKKKIRHKQGYDNDKYIQSRPY